MKQLSHWLTQPLFIIGVLFALLLTLTPVSDLAFIGESVGGSALVKIFTALIAGFTLMGLVKLATVMRVLFSDGNPNGLFQNMVAKAILLSGLYLAFAIVVASIFG